MAGNTQVDRAEMAKAAGQIEAALGQITNVQKNLGSNVQGLMAGWSGNAAQKYARSFTEFDSQFTVVLNEFETLHGKLVDTQISYTQNESEQEEATSAIVSALNN